MRGKEVILRIFVFRTKKNVIEPSKDGLFEILGSEARPELIDIEAARFESEKKLYVFQSIPFKLIHQPM